MRTHIKTVMFVVIGVSLGFVIWFGLLIRASGAAQQNPKRPVLSKLPEIKSCLEHIKLVKAELVNQGDSQVAVLELENQAYIGVISISIETTGDKEKHSVVWSAFTPDKPPLIIIPPGEKGRIAIGDLSAYSPIRIGGVMFSDGTEEGCEASLKSMRKLKEFHTKKGGAQR